ncbi:MAG: TRAP transporter small permease [Pseudomonadota bacterium]|nr:TRAP transporter small permease [Pseudomonadota bacterium]
MTRFWAVIDRTVEMAIFVIFLGIVIVGTMQVCNRFFLNLSLSWSEELQRYGQIWIVFLGVPVAYRYCAHIGMETLTDLLSERGRAVFFAIVDLLWIVLAIALISGTVELSRFLQLQKSPGMGLPMHLVYAAIPIGSGYMVIIALRRLFAFLKHGPQFDSQIRN